MFLRNSIAKDLRWRFADPISLLIWIGVPLLIGGLMSLAFGNGSKALAPRPHLLVAGAEDPVFAEMLPSMEDRWRIERVELPDGKARITAGDASALLVVPKDFGASFLFDQPTELTLFTNPSQRILPGMIQSELEARLVDGQFYMKRLPLPVLTKLRDGKGDLLKTLDQATATSRDSKAKAVRSALFPLLLEVEEEKTPKQLAQQKARAGSATTPSVGLLLFPGILFMALMFMAQGMSFDVWREKDQGTLHRLLCSPTGAGTFLLSKILAGGLLMAGVIAIALVLGHLVFGVRLAALPAALGWCTFAGMCILVLFFVVQMLATTSRGANVLSSTLLFPMMMIGGAFFPLDSMPKSLASIGRLTPNGTAVEQLEDILGGSVTAAGFAQATVILAATGGVLFWVATRMLRGRFARN